MPLLEKQCPTCKQVLPVEMFYKNKTKRDGLSSVCKHCHSRSQALWLANGGREKLKAYEKANSVSRKTRNMFSDARARAKKKNLPFDIDLDYVRSMIGENAQIALRCPVLGMPLDWSAQRSESVGALPNSPSLDRIDPERGYVKGNVWIISHRANTIKSNATHEELKLVTKAVGEAIVNSLEF